MRLAVPHFNRLTGESSWDTFPSGNVCSCLFQTKNNLKKTDLGSCMNNEKMESIYDRNQESLANINL